MKLHERTGRIVGVTRNGAQIVEFDHPEGFGGEPARCCQHPDCEALPARQEAMTWNVGSHWGPFDDRGYHPWVVPTSSLGTRVRVWWERTASGGGLAGEVIGDAEYPPQDAGGLL